jgi:8-oxo-dGTP pyrophosphatase MutT (NUDIX family)
VTFDEILGRLQAARISPLPGTRAHDLMAPTPRRSWPVGFDRHLARPAAGLLLVYPVHDRPHVVLTIRSSALGHHRGQVSLPGGAIEPGETPEHAARREAREEIGLSPEHVKVLGRLTPVDIVVSGFRLHPVLAIMPSRPLLEPSHNEVSRIVEIAIDTLADPRSLAWRSAARGGETFRYPAFVADGIEIWGATAMILAEMLSLLGWRGHTVADRSHPM